MQRLLDFGLVLGLVALVLSVGSFLVLVLRLAMRLGMEFVEKKETRELRKKIDDKLEEEWSIGFAAFLDRSIDRKKATFDKKKVADELPRLMESITHARIASTLLKVIPNLSSSVMKEVISTIGAIGLLVILVWAVLSFPEESFAYYAVMFAFLATLIAIAQGVNAVRNTRSYMFFRSQFHELSETPSLSKASDIMDELERRELVVA